MAYSRVEIRKSSRGRYRGMVVTDDGKVTLMTATSYSTILEAQNALFDGYGVLRYHYAKTEATRGRRKRWWAFWR